MSAFCSGLCNEISRCCYDFYHAPFTKKNLLIGGGVMVGLIILIIIIVVATGGTSHKPETAEDLLKQYPLIDGANSMAKNIKDEFKDNLSSFPKGLINNTLKCSSCQTDLARLNAGHVATQVFVVTTDCIAEYKDAVSQTLEQIDLLTRIVNWSKNSKGMMLIKKEADILKAFNEKKTGVIISLWGGHNIDSRLGVLRMYYELGVRIMSLVSADPKTNTPCVPPWIGNDTLTDFGKKVINEMNRLGMIIDLTGSSINLQKNVISTTTAPVIFSHSGSYSINSNPLNVDDSVLNNNVEKIGVVMVPFTPSQLSSGASTLANVTAHLDKLYKELKSTTKLGIGSNFDNMTEVTKDLQDVSKFVNLIQHLKNRKTPSDGIEWTNSNLEQLISKNFRDTFSNIEKRAKQIQANTTTSQPDDSLVPENYYPSNNRACYSDFDIRYKNQPTTSPTTQATTVATSKPTPTKPN